MKYLLFGTLFLLSACGGSDSESEEGAFEPEFIDQQAQGTINGRAVSSFSHQVFEESNFIEGSLSIDLCEEAPEDGGIFCDIKVGVTVPAEVGVHQLVTDEAFLGTFIDSTEEVPQNIVVDEGAVEILSLDLDAGIVEGRIDAHGSGDSVNGNFRALNPDAPNFMSGAGGANN